MKVWENQQDQDGETLQRTPDYLVKLYTDYVK